MYDLENGQGYAEEIARKEYLTTVSLIFPLIAKPTKVLTVSTHSVFCDFLTPLKKLK